MSTITAFYDSVADAEAAASVLRDGGFDRSAIKIHEQSSSTSTDAARNDLQGDDGGGFFASLRDLFVPDEDRYTYAEGIRRGGALLTVHASERDDQLAIDLLERTGAVDLETRQSEWQKEGWSGQQAAGTGERTTRTEGGEEHIPIVEEQLRVGKRQVNRGSVRIRSYMVETPVEEQVTLRDEHVTVERHAVSGGSVGPDAFRERTIEVTETDEEAVVDKSARVTEEVVVRKDAEQHTETVSDTVRRTEVEVDDDRTGHGVAKTTDTDRTRDRT